MWSIHRPKASTVSNTRMQNAPYLRGAAVHCEEWQRANARLSLCAVWRKKEENRPFAFYECSRRQKRRQRAARMVEALQQEQTANVSTRSRPRRPSYGGAGRVFCPPRVQYSPPARKPETDGRRAFSFGRVLDVFPKYRNSIDYAEK